MAYANYFTWYIDLGYHLFPMSSLLALLLSFSVCPWHCTYPGPCVSSA